jgi:pantoate--beta-alanine ligase
VIQHIDSHDALRNQRKTWRAEGLTVAFVPTMGALHAGHLSLVKTARAACDRVIVSIFVNPTQFAPGEDLESYPRDLAGDSKNLESAGADAVFTTTPGEMYPDGFATWVTVEGLTDTLCGAARPDHFRGVTTVVAKLFHLVDPDDAYFGEKDRQQLTVLTRMARDLNMRVRVHGCPIVRERDGLALSSRNAYLSEDERARGLALSKGLRLASEAYAAGERSAAAITTLIRAALDDAQARVDYVTAVSPLTLQAVDTVDEGTFVAVAAFFGSTRLIDNHVLSRSFPA